MIDEAKHLVDLSSYNAFRWVIDEVIEQGFLVERPNASRPLPFMVFFLGTNSKVADFLPPDEDSSERFYSSFLKVHNRLCSRLGYKCRKKSGSTIHYSDIRLPRGNDVALPVG